jgi:hypothetical protein
MTTAQASCTSAPECKAMSKALSEPHSPKSNGPFGSVAASLQPKSTLKLMAMGTHCRLSRPIECKRDILASIVHGGLGSA